MIGRRVMLVKKLEARVNGTGLQAHYYTTHVDLPCSKRVIGTVQGYIPRGDRGVDLIVEVGPGLLALWEHWCVRLLPDV